MFNNIYHVNERMIGARMPYEQQERPSEASAVLALMWG